MSNVLKEGVLTEGFWGVLKVYPRGGALTTAALPVHSNRPLALRLVGHPMAIVAIKAVAILVAVDVLSAASIPLLQDLARHLARLVHTAAKRSDVREVDTNVVPFKLLVPSRPSLAVSVLGHYLPFTEILPTVRRPLATSGFIFLLVRGSSTLGFELRIVRSSKALSGVRHRKPRSSSRVPSNCL